MIYYTCSYMTGLLTLVGATSECKGRGMTIAAACAGTTGTGTAGLVVRGRPGTSCHRRRRIRQPQHQCIAPEQHTDVVHLPPHAAPCRGHIDITAGSATNMTASVIASASKPASAPAPASARTPNPTSASTVGAARKRCSSRRWA